MHKLLALGSVQRCTSHKKRQTARMQGKLVINYSLGWQIDFEKVKSDFEAAVLLNENDTPSVEVVEKGHKTGERRKTTMEEVEDVDVLQARQKPKSERPM